MFLKHVLGPQKWLVPGLGKFVQSRQSGAETSFTKPGTRHFLNLVLCFEYQDLLHLGHLQHSNEVALMDTPSWNFDITWWIHVAQLESVCCNCNIATRLPWWTDHYEILTLHKWISRNTRWMWMWRVFFHVPGSWQSRTCWQTGRHEILTLGPIQVVEMKAFCN